MSVNPFARFSVRIPGVRVGHYTDLKGVTGCTVILAPPEGAVAGVDVRGPAPGTRETELLRTGHLVDRAHAILLAGGSAFGLDAAAGVMRFLEERHIGFDARVARVPIVSAAVLFDLGIGDATARPDAAAGYAACQTATEDAIEQGSVGAGTGATVGKLYGTRYATKGGLGSATRQISSPDNLITVTAIVVVNAFGDIIDSTHGKIIAGTRNPNAAGWMDTARALQSGLIPQEAPFSNTTIGVVVTDAQLDAEQANIVAMMAHNGIARVISPAHSMFDGDTLFVLATGSGGKGDVTAIGHTAAELVAAAILNAIRSAQSLGGVRAIRDD